MEQSKTTKKNETEEQEKKNTQGAWSVTRQKEGN